ncbi:S1 family peptidase (plasmid) [Streptomyces sp. NBC_01201]|uniref:trypsin-like serine protease n=1 Tax=Streptomyces sp. NBC_01201 TaxID=2903770 RepID=UPI002E144C88|nr:S1 family peptidase [Streptomyces sp. NBC_01201]
MSGTRSRSAWAAVLLTAAVSVGSLTGVPAQAVDGDAAANGANTFTAKVDVGGVRACSGTLINNQWLITAASCFVDDPAQARALAAGAPKLKSTATIGRTNLTGTMGQVREITQLIPRTDRDLVLAKLASPVSGPSFLHPATTAPVAEEALKTAGYGRTKDTWVPNTLHTGALTAGPVEATSIAVDGTPLCKGDTGAPVFREKNGRPELAAIATNSWQGGCLGSDESRTGAIASRVDDIRAWITENTASTLNVWNLQMLAKTTSGLYHSMRNSNGDWTSFGNVLNAAGTIEDLEFAADAAIKGKNYVFAVGGNGHLYQANRRATGGWEAFRDITTEVGDKPGLTRVAVTSTGTGLALIGLANGRVYHATQDANEVWTKWGDVSGKLGVLGNATQVTVAHTSGGETQVGVAADGKAYHGIRKSDGSWSARWGSVSGLATGLTAKINGMSFASVASDLQIVLTAVDGNKKHATRKASGSWSTFGDLGDELGRDTTIGVDATAVNGELQAAVVTTDGKIKHTLRHADGKWDATEQVVGYPGTVESIALTGSTV